MKWTEKARKDLSAILSNYCMESFLQANQKKDGTFYKKRRPYSVPTEGLKALELIKITQKDNITRKEEEEVKSFLMPYRIIRTEYLINTDEKLR